MGGTGGPLALMGVEGFNVGLLPLAAAPVLDGVVDRPINEEILLSLAGLCLLSTPVTMMKQ